MSLISWHLVLNQSNHPLSFFIRNEVDKIVKSNIRFRYISFHVTIPGNTRSFTSSDLIHAMRQSIQDFFHKDITELKFWLIQFNGNSGIIKCFSQNKEQVMYLLQSLKKIGITPVVITTFSTSGTIHGLSKKKMKS